MWLKFLSFSPRLAHSAVLFLFPSLKLMYTYKGFNSCPKFIYIAQMHSGKELHLFNKDLLRDFYVPSTF